MKDVPYQFRYGDSLPEPEEQLREEAEWMRVLTREALGHFIERNNVYRSRFREDGLAGVLSSIRDKLQRLGSLLQGRRKPEEEEGIVANLLDVAVYALMGAMIPELETGSALTCAHLYSGQSETDDLVCVLCGARYCG